MDRTGSSNLYSFLALAAIGLTGAFGEAAILYNDFVHSYPYKMMDLPPAEFYAQIGQVGYHVAIAASVFGVMYTFRLPRILVAVVPVVLSPLAYWLTFGVAHMLAGYSNAQMTGRNFEGATGYSNFADASSTSIILIVVGAVIAYGLSFVLLKAESIWRRSYETL